jgi:hypothetical protein
MSGTRHRPQRNWAGISVPVALIVALLGDGLSRFMSLDRFAIRAWEAMTRTAFVEGGMPFEPSKRYATERAYGDSAAVSNRRDLREYHREVFTSDQFGYRNVAPFSRATPPDAILIGSSFSVGCAVSDHETLAVRLSAQTGRRIYNGAGSTLSPGNVAAIAHRFGVRQGTVLFELLETSRLPERPAPIAWSTKLCVDTLGLACLRVKGWLRASPAEIVSRRAYRWLENDLWLPNTPAQQAISYLLDNQPILFAEDRIISCPEVTSRLAADYFQWFRDGLNGLGLFVILVPSKFSVYRPLLDLPMTAEEGSDKASCFATISRSLEDRGIPYVNLTEPLRRAARDALSHGQLLYFRGDTHWNAAGIEIAAKVIARAWSAPARPSASTRISSEYQPAATDLESTPARPATGQRNK